MGHLRLGTLPDTAPWRRVIALIADGKSVAQIADETMAAAQRGLEIAHGDPSLGQVVLLLSKLALAARQADFSGELANAGIQIPSGADVYDIVGGFADAVDVQMQKWTNRTDIAEMAQLAAVETLTARLNDRTDGLLFGSTDADVKQAVYEFSTKVGFASLTHEFFSRFTYRFLSYHLSRELPHHVGVNGRFGDPNEHTEFNRQLRTHCRQAAAIVREFAGDWYSKANFEGGVTLRRARGFCDHALTKLQKELRIRGERDVE